MLAHHECRRRRARGGQPRHRVGLRGRAGAQRERRDPLLRHVVAARARARRAGADRPGARVQPHQRARDRRHDPPAQQRDGPVAGAGVPPPLGRVVRRAARAGRAGARRRAAVRSRRRALPAPGRHAGADRRRLRRGRPAAAGGPRGDRALRAHLARLQVPPRARAPRARHRPRGRGRARDRRRRAQRAAVPADRRPARPAGARRAGRGDRARQRPRAGARRRRAGLAGRAARRRRGVGRARGVTSRRATPAASTTASSR